MRPRTTENSCLAQENPRNLAGLLAERSGGGFASSPDVPASALGPRIIDGLHADCRVERETSGLAILFSQSAGAWHRRRAMLRPFRFVRWIVLPAGLLLVGVPAVHPESAAAGITPSTSPTSAALRLVPAADPRFHYEGRFDRADPAAPVVVWQGGRIRIDFTGDQLVLRFDGLSGQNFFDVHVDDAQAILAVPAGVGQRIACPLTLTGGRHRLLLFK